MLAFKQNHHFRNRDWALKYSVCLSFQHVTGLKSTCRIYAGEPAFEGRPAASVGGHGELGWPREGTGPSTRQSTEQGAAGRQAEEEQQHLNSSKHTQGPPLGFYSPISTTRNQGFLEKRLILGLERRKHKCQEHTRPESEEVLEQCGGGRVTSKGPRSKPEGSHRPPRQCEQSK